MSYLKYFAYGSNMLTARLERRVPSTIAVGPARLEGYRLCFHKRGADGSAKCDIVADQDGLVHGVLFHIADDERYLLDRAEGLGHGYTLADVELEAPDGPVEAFCYVASPRHIDKSLLPFGWYKDFVVHGAREHDLPWTYRKRLRRVEALDDTSPARAKKNRRILTGANDAQPAAVPSAE